MLIPLEGTEREVLLRFGVDDETEKSLTFLFLYNRQAIETEPDAATFKALLDWIIEQSGHHQQAWRFFGKFSAFLPQAAKNETIIKPVFNKLWDASKIEVQVRAAANNEVVSESDTSTPGTSTGFFSRLYKT